VAIDDATRLAYAAILPDETAVSTAALLAQAGWFARHGLRLEAVMTDNGSGYRGRRFQALRRQLGAQHLWTRPYTPRTNGKAERFIRTCLEASSGPWARLSVQESAALPSSEKARIRCGISRPRASALGRTADARAVLALA
jgi:transposase InsO family protein